MNENKSSQEKGFRSLIAQYNNNSETRDKLICEIEIIIDRIKQNPKLVAESGLDASTKEADPDIITHFTNILRWLECSNEKLKNIVNRLNELA